MNLQPIPKVKLLFTRVKRRSTKVFLKLDLALQVLVTSLRTIIEL